MWEIFRAEGIKAEPQYTIDTRGVIIFKLPDGGSIRDDETIAACQDAGVALYFTGTRHFFH